MLLSIGSSPWPWEWMQIEVDRLFSSAFILSVLREETYVVGSWVSCSGKVSSCSEFFITKNWVTRPSNVHFRPQAHKYCHIIFKKMRKYIGKIKILLSYTLLSSNVEVGVSSLTITLSRNDKAYPKTEKKCKPDFEIGAVTELNCEWARTRYYEPAKSCKECAKMLKWIDKFWVLLNVLVSNSNL